MILTLLFQSNIIYMFKFPTSVFLHGAPITHLSIMTQSSIYHYKPLAKKYERHLETNDRKIRRAHQ